MGWHKTDDDYFMTKVSPRRAQLQLAAFAIHLSMGNNVYMKRIRLSTIKAYVNAVSDVVRTQRKDRRDVRFDGQGDTTFGRSLNSIYKEIKRYEDVPNRREPFTPKMLANYIQYASTYSTFSLERALADWFIIGTFAGLRCGEYAQTKTNLRDPHKPAKNCRGGTRAFCINDVRFRLKTGKYVTGAAITSVNPSLIASMWLKFRTQKNGQNGVERLFEPVQGKDKSFCPIRAVYRIIQRFCALCHPLHTTTPLSVYKAKNGVVQLITSDNITKQMRQCACRTYNLTQGKDDAHINRWSAHSLRVGACVFLHSQGFSPLDIKWLLRWESDAYFVYLRNFSGLAKKHTRAFENIPDDAIGPAMPHVFVAPSA